MKDICFNEDNKRFNLRAAAIIIKDNHLLVMKDGHAPYYYLPGGRVQFNEQSDQSLIRELKEELNTKATIDHLLWIAESFFNEDVLKLDYHELCFYYLVNTNFNNLDSFTTSEDNKTLSYYWLPISSLKDEYIYPEFIKTEIHNLPITAKHIYEHQ